MTLTTRLLTGPITTNLKKKTTLSSKMVNGITMVKPHNSSTVNGKVLIMSFSKTGHNKLLDHKVISYITTSKEVAGWINQTSKSNGQGIPSLDNLVVSFTSINNKVELSSQVVMVVVLISFTTTTILNQCQIKVEKL